MQQFQSTLNMQNDHIFACQQSFFFWKDSIKFDKVDKFRKSLLPPLMQS